MKNKYFYILLSLYFLASPHAQASHALGGEIWWDCLPSGQIIIKMKLYRDCYGATLFGNETVLIRNSATGTAQSVPMIFQSSSDISPVCFPVPGGALQSSCGAFNGNNGNGPGAAQANYYESAPVTLSGPVPNSGLALTWNQCCRNSSIDNITGAAATGYTLRAILYPAALSGSNGGCGDHAPRFWESPATAVQTGNSTGFYTGGYDPDSDSLYYAWDYPLDDPSSSIAWNPPVNPQPVLFAQGYAFDQPFPGIGLNPNNTPAILDPSSGSVQMNCYTPGSYVYDIRLESWRNGQKLAEVHREFVI